MLKTLQGFKDFILRGNVVDLAVGIVIGAAFTALVTSFTGSFIEPLLNAFGARGKETKGAGVWHLAGQDFGWAAFLNAIIAFLITAAVLYFLVVLPTNKLAERRRRGQEPPSAAPSEEVRLLTEIRDALQAGASVPGPRSGTAPAFEGPSTPPAERPAPQH